MLTPRVPSAPSGILLSPEGEGPYVALCLRAALSSDFIGHPSRALPMVAGTGFTLLPSAQRETAVWPGGLITSLGLADPPALLSSFLSRAPADFQARHQTANVARSGIEDRPRAVSTI